MIWAPCFSSLMIIFVGILAGDSPHLIFLSLRRKLLLMVVSLWLIWPFAHLATYYIIPARFRQTFLNAVQVLSNIVSSVVLH